MRCPSCGTQNEPDSRFCGGCGARLQGTLAPTHKIVPDPAVANVPMPAVPQRTYPQPGTPSREQQAQAIARQVSAEHAAQRPQTASAPQPIPRASGATPSAPIPRGSVATPSAPQAIPRTSSVAPSAPNPMPNVNQIRPSAPAQAVSTNDRSAPVQRSSSAPPGSYAAPRATPRDGAPMPSRPRGSQSLDRPIAAPKRNWGLIIIVLVFDLGLAAAGVYLLNEGLSAGQAPEPPPKTGTAATPTTPVATQAPAPAVDPPAPGDAAASGSADVKTVAAGGADVKTVAAGSAEAKPDPMPPEEPRNAGSAQGRKVTTPKRKNPKPIDPYEDKPAPGPALGPEQPPPPGTE